MLTRGRTCRPGKTWRGNMSDLIVVAFDDEATAFEMRAALVNSLNI